MLFRSPQRINERQRGVTNQRQIRQRVFKSLWVNSTLANAVFEYSLPDLALVGHTSLPLVYPLGHVPTGSVPEWITFTPDSRLVYISNSGNRLVSAIDTKTLKLVAVIPVGEVPKRIDTLVLH